jgi:hypothetical protein
LRPLEAVTSVGAVTARGVTICIALALGAAACSDDEPRAASTTTTVEDPTTTSTTTSVPERPPSTTTTAFDPASVEGAVEAAYLRSWDVYADAVYNLELDDQALAEVYAEDALDLRINEIARRIDEGRASFVRVDHAYQIVPTDAATFSVIDTFVNHQVLIDADTKEPTEEDPNETLLVNFTLELVDDSWRVTFIQKVTP